MSSTRFLSLIVCVAAIVSLTGCSLLSPVPTPDVQSSTPSLLMPEKIPLLSGSTCIHADDGNFTTFDAWSDGTSVDEAAPVAEKIGVEALYAPYDECVIEGYFAVAALTDHCMIALSVIMTTSQENVTLESYRLDPAEGLFYDGLIPDLTLEEAAEEVQRFRQDCGEPADATPASNGVNV